MAVSQELLDELWDFADPPGSLSRIEAAMAGAADPEDLAELATQRARALGLLEQYDAATEALAAVPDTSALVAARVALELGRVRNDAGDAEAAAVQFRRAEQLAADAGSLFLRVDALHMLAIVDPDGAQGWTSTALDLLATTDDPRTLRWQVALHSNAGWTLFDDGRVAEAMSRFEQARAAALRWGTPQQVAFADEALAECRGVLDV